MVKLNKKCVFSTPSERFNMRCVYRYLRVNGWTATAARAEVYNYAHESGIL